MFRRQQLQLQARRQAFKEPKKKFSWQFLLTSFKILVVGVILVVIVWNVYTLHQRNDFALEKVKVVATYEHLDSKMLQNIIESCVSTNFFDVDTANLRRELLRLPWVYRVSIRRKWPDTILVNIEEQKAIAQWKDEALLNIDGMLFTPPKETFPVGLPLLNGPEDDIQEVVNNYRKMEAMLETLGFKITQLAVDEQYVWRVTLNTEGNILLNSDNVLEDLQKFVDIYPKIIANHPNEVIEMVDLRYKDGMAVKWVQSTSKPDKI